MEVCDFDFLAVEKSVEKWKSEGFVGERGSGTVVAGWNWGLVWFWESFWVYFRGDGLFWF